MRACLQSVGSGYGPYADNDFAIGAHQTFALRHHAADIILLARHHSAKTEIGSSRRAIELSSRHMALLDAHHRERLHAIGCDPELLACMHEQFCSEIAIIGRNRKLIGMLTGKRNAEKPRRKPAENAHLLGCKIGKAVVVQLDAIAYFLERC